MADFNKLVWADPAVSLPIDGVCAALLKQSSAERSDIVGMLQATRGYDAVSMLGLVVCEAEMASILPMYKKGYHLTDEEMEIFMDDYFAKIRETYRTQLAAAVSMGYFEKG